MTGIETRTRYCQGEDVLQITADGAYTEITWKKADGGFYFYRGDETGSVLGETQLTEGVYHGETVVIYSDPEGNEVRTYSAVLDNNICTEQIVRRSAAGRGCKDVCEQNVINRGCSETISRAAEARIWRCIRILQKYTTNSWTIPLMSSGLSAWTA